MNLTRRDYPQMPGIYVFITQAIYCLRDSMKSGTFQLKLALIFIISVKNSSSFVKLHTIE